MTELTIQATSIVGAFLLLSAFFLLQRKVWQSNSTAYLLFNFLGSTLLAIVAISDRRIGFVILEAVWAAVSIWSLFDRSRTQSAR